MELAHTGCCAVLEIDGLSDYESPEAAMEDVVENLFDEGGGDWEREYDENDRLIKKVKAKVPVPGFILFTGVVECECGDRCSTGYGEKFEAFIRKEKLGLVRGSAARPNRLNHPDHKVRVWTWAPSPKGMEAWWGKWKGEEKVKKSAKAKGA